MKRIKGRKASALAAILGASLLAGCAAEPRLVEIRPQCEVPPEPTLPAIDRGELWDALGDDRYRELERYINGVWAWADENAALLRAICEE